MTTNLFLAPPTYPHTIVLSDKEQTLHFRPISVGMLAKVRALAIPLGQFVSTLFNDNRNDNTSSTNTFNHEDGTQDSQFVVQGIHPELAAERHRQKMQAVEALVNMATDDRNLRALAEVVIDSLHDGCPADLRDPDEFLRRVSLPVFGQMLLGVAKANQGVFGPLGSRVASLSKTIEDAIRSKVAETKADEPEPETAGKPKRTRGAASKTK